MGGECVSSSQRRSRIDRVRSQVSFLSGFSERKKQKNTFFQKRTGEVIENKGSGPKNEPDRTGKRSGEVVENTYLWKKRTENEPENLASSPLIQSSGPMIKAVPLLRPGSRRARVVYFATGCSTSDDELPSLRASDRMLVQGSSLAQIDTNNSRRKTS